MLHLPKAMQNHWSFICNKMQHHWALQRSKNLQKSKSLLNRPTFRPIFYPPGNYHIPPGEKENHRLKSALVGDMLVPQEGIFRTSQMEIHPSNLQRQKISKSTWDLEPTEKSPFSAKPSKPSYPPSDHGTQDTEPQHATWTSCFSLSQRWCIR